MLRAMAFTVVLFALTAGDARAAAFEVVVVPGLELSDLSRLADEGAVGLLVPSAGPETSAKLARAGLARGEAAHSLRGGLPSGPPLIRWRTGAFGSVNRPAIYLGLPAGGPAPNDRRYPIVVVGRGYEGILTSGSTRLAGLVSVVDVAPTALGEEGELGHASRENAAGELLALDQRIEQNGDTRRAASLVVCGLVLVLVAAFPPAGAAAIAAALLANLALGVAGISAPWTVLLVLSLAVVGGGLLLAFVLTKPLVLGVGLAAVVVAYLLALGLDGATVALSPLGPSQNARFYGLSNLLETLLLLPAFAGAALLAARLGWTGFGAVAAVTFVAVAGNRFGADGGGAIVLAVGFAVLGVLLAGAGRRALAIAAGVALALVLALLALDAVTGAASHVTRALESGPAGLADDLRDRVVLSYDRATDTWYAALGVAALVAVIALLAVRTVRRRGVGPGTAVPLALAAAIAISLVVNDSPVDVPLVGLAAYLAGDRGMLPARWAGPCRSRSPCSSSRSPSQPPAAAAARQSSPSPRP